MSSLAVQRFFIGVVSAVVMSQTSPFLAHAENSETISTPRYTLVVGTEKTSHGENRVIDSKLTTQAVRILDSTHDELTRILRYTPKDPVLLKFLSKEDFEKETGAPAWTSAMFYKGQITIPVTSAESPDLDELSRALRHEYVHAIVGEASDYKCPAWYDEGLAQLIEGKPNSLLGPALRKWIKDNRAMPFTWLESGFTTLQDEFVPAAYAQSLFATRSLVNQYGFNAVSTYLTKLRSGKNTAQAFAETYSDSIENFENTLNTQMLRWAHSSHVHP